MQRNKIITFSVHVKMPPVNQWPSKACLYFYYLDIEGFFTVLVPVAIVLQEKCAKCTHIPKNDLPHCVISMCCPTVAFCLLWLSSAPNTVSQVIEHTGLSKGMLVMQSNID